MPVVASRGHEPGEARRHTATVDETRDPELMQLASREDPPAPLRKDGRRWGCGLEYETRAVVLAEFAGTALLVLLSCLPGCAGAGPEARAAAAGLAVALLVQCFDHISGAVLNPTVLLAALTARRVPATRAAAMLLAQLAGAAAGGGLLQLLAPAPAHGSPADACLTLPAPGLPLYKAVCIEAVLGGVLALANLASWDARNRLLLDSWPLRMGLSVAGLSVIGGSVTGASMNPARSLAPALWAARWDHHWVYWAGPLSGSLSSALLYRAVWAPRGPAPARAAPPAPAPAPAPAPQTSHHSV